MESRVLMIVPAQPTEEDGKRVMEWRNDPITREMSFNQQIKQWDTFKTEYCVNYFKNIPLFATLNEEKIAFVSLIRLSEQEYKIGINIRKQNRGQKLGAPILQETIKYARRMHPGIRRIVAEVKDDNVASKKTFQRAGFVHQKEEERVICDQEIKVHTYLYSML